MATPALSPTGCRPLSSDCHVADPWWAGRSLFNMAFCFHSLLFNFLFGCIDLQFWVEIHKTKVAQLLAHYHRPPTLFLPLFVMFTDGAEGTCQTYSLSLLFCGSGNGDHILFSASVDLRDHSVGRTVNQFFLLHAWCPVEDVLHLAQPLLWPHSRSGCWCGFKVN